MAYGGVGGRGPARSGGPHVVGVAASGTYGSRRRGASRAADIGVALRRRRPPRGLSHSHAGRDRPGPTAREPVHVAGSSACRRRPGATTAGTGLRCRRAPALGHADGGLPLGSAVVFPAAAGPGLRRGSQSVPRAVRSAAGPGPLPPELCYAAAGGRRFATAECRRRPLLWPSRNLAGRCRPGPTAREPVHAAGSSACRRRPGATSTGARLRRRREPALSHAAGGLPLGSAAVLPAAAGPGPRPSVPRAVRSAAAGPGPLPPGRGYAAAGGRRFTTPGFRKGTRQRRG